MSYLRVVFGLVFLLSLALAYNNCAQTGEAPTSPIVTKIEAKDCNFGTTATGRVTTYGSWSNGLDYCYSFDGTTSRWTGMDTNTALVAIPNSLFNNGMACGQCVEIKGSAGTVTGRVATFCGGCSDDQIDMNIEAFAAVTGGTDGIHPVTIKAIPCPLTQGLRVTMNTGTNPFYLNVTPTNHRSYIESMEVDAGSGFIPMARVSNSQAFAATMGGAVGPSVQMRIKDGFGQTLTTTVNPAVGQVTQTSLQFGTCN